MTITPPYAHLPHPAFFCLSFGALPSTFPPRPPAPPYPCPYACRLPGGRRWTWLLRLGCPADETGAICIFPTFTSLPFSYPFFLISISPVSHHDLCTRGFSFDIVVAVVGGRCVCRLRERTRHAPLPALY